MSSPSHSRWQFSLRRLMLATAAIAVLTLVASRVGWIEAGGVAVAMALGVVFVSLKSIWGAFILRPLTACLAFAIIWMVGVDYSQSFHFCPHCGLNWGADGFHVFRLPIYARRSSNDQEVLSQIASDLGHPCRHQFQHQTTIRLWGFVYPNPAICGIRGLTGGEWYFEPLREKMRKLGRENPKLGPEFHQRVIMQRDYKYCKEFVRNFRAEHDPKF